MFSDRACCRAMTADCLACTADQTIEDWCKEHLEDRGCKGNNIGLIKILIDVL